LEARGLYIRPEAAKARVGRTLILSPFTTQILAKFLKVQPEWWGDGVPLFTIENDGTLNRTH